MNEQSLEDVLAEQNFLHTAYHLRGVINETLELLEVLGYQEQSDRLENAMTNFADALTEWTERLPDVEIQEIEE